MDPQDKLRQEIIDATLFKKERLAPASAQKFCSACGRTINESFSYCPSCGNPVGPHAVAAPGSMSSGEVTPGYSGANSKSVAKTLLGPLQEVFVNKQEMADEVDEVTDAARAVVVEGIDKNRINSLLGGLRR